MKSNSYPRINGSAKARALIASIMGMLILSLILSIMCQPTLAYQSGSGSPDLAGPIYISTNSGITWATISNGISGNAVNTFVMDPLTPTTLYAGTNRGVFKTTDGGNQWRSSPGFISLYRIHDLAVDPVNPSNVYAVGVGIGGTHIFKSTDAGDNWKPISFGFSQTTLSFLRINPKNPAVLYVRNGLNIFKSTDSGEHWAIVHTSPDSDDVLFLFTLTIDPLNPSTLYSVSSNYIYRTTDDGANWLDITDRIPLTMPEFQEFHADVIIDPVDSSIVYKTSFNNFGGYLYKSTDAGETWAAVPNKTGVPTLNLAIDPHETSTLYTTLIELSKGRRTLFKSTNGGMDWVETGLSGQDEIFFIDILPQYKLIFDPAHPTTLYAASTGIRQATDSPWIRVSAIEGKKLLVIGENFDDGAVILLDGEEQPTKNDKFTPISRLIGKTAGKRVKKRPDAKIQIRNASGKLSQEVTIWPPLD